MAIWTVEQKVEVWYKTSVEADTPDQAIELANERDDWYRDNDKGNQEWTEEYWLMNEDTTDQFMYHNGNITKEA